MAMSPRLLRPRASSALVATDADARAYINAVRTADGGQYMEAGVQRAINTFITGCKADGIWTAIKASCILMGARTLSGALTPLVGTAPTNNNFVSGDYNRKTGLIGNASTKSLNTNRAGNADPQNNCHAAIYGSSLTAGVSSPFNAKVWMASASAGNTAKNVGLFWLNLGAGNTGYFANLRRDGNNFILNTSLGSSGFVGVSRAASASYTVRLKGGDNTASVNSVVPSSDNVHVFSGNAGGTLSDYSDSRLAFYSIGESLNLALLDSRVSTLYTAIGAAIP